jgi:hypothetical protein
VLRDRPTPERAVFDASRLGAAMPEGIRSSLITEVTFRLGLRGDALTITREAFSSSDDLRQATGCSDFLGDSFRILREYGKGRSIMPAVVRP